MTEFLYIAGIDIASIANKEFIRIDTDKAQEICVALDKSGIPFSARYGETEMVLTYVYASGQAEHLYMVYRQ